MTAGCSAAYPDGKILCNSNAECPSGFTCRATDAKGGELFCFAGALPGSVDSGTRPAESSAAVGDAAAHEEKMDASQGEAGTTMMTVTSGSGGNSPGVAEGASGRAATQEDASDQDAAADSGTRDGAVGVPAADSGAERKDAGGSSCDDTLSECEPGTSETQQLPCGACNSGTRAAARSCGADCRWGAPEWMGTCTGVTAACKPGDSMMETRACECGRMQSRTMTCSDSCAWVGGVWGECDLTGVECLPGDSMMETRACECGRTASRTLTCSDSCTWAGGAWGECDLTGVECQPGRTQTQTVACASCGTRTQQRSCDADSCRWGGWTDVSSACASSCEGCAEVQFCMAPANQPNPGGTKCRQMDRACTREQALSDCQEDIPVVCGAVHEPFYMQYL